MKNANTAMVQASETIHTCRVNAMAAMAQVKSDHLKHGTHSAQKMFQNLHTSATSRAGLKSVNQSGASGPTTWRMMMTTSVTIELDFDSDTVTSVDVINRIKELIESDSLHFRWERDEDRHE